MSPALICGLVVCGFVVLMFLSSVVSTLVHIHASSKVRTSSKVVVAPFEEEAPAISVAGTEGEQPKEKERERETIQMEDIEDI